MSRADGRRSAVRLLIAVVAVVALASAANATRPAQSAGDTLAPVTAGGGSGSVVRSLVICPDLRIRPGTVNTTVIAGTGSRGTGSVTLASATDATGAPGTTLLTGKATTPVRGSYAGPLTGPLALSARGTLTGSLVAEQISHGDEASDRGWSEARCEVPRAQQWFVGAATEAGDAPVLQLVDAGDTAATVDVSVLTAAGLQQTAAGHNIALAPHSVVQFAVAALAPGANATAVHVDVLDGQVAASVRDVRADGATLLGTDYVPVSHAAASLTIGGLPGRVVGALARRILVVGAPADTDATVRVAVTGPSGTFTPSGLDALAVPAGSIRTLDLTSRLGTSSSAVTVTSADASVPVVAGVFVDAASTKGVPIHELTYLGPTDPLQGAALVPVVHTAGTVDSVLEVAAPQAAAVLDLAVTAPSGAVTRSSLAVAPGTAFTTSLRSRGVPDGSSLTVTPEAGSGPAYVVRLIEEDGDLGPLLSSFAPVGAAAQQPVPRVALQPVTSGGS